MKCAYSGEVYDVGDVDAVVAPDFGAVLLSNNMVSQQLLLFSEPGDSSTNVFDLLESNEAQANTDVHSVPGLRPGSVRFHTGEGYFFHRQRASNGRVFLRCVLYRSNPSCPVRAVMNQDMTGFVISGGEHNHGPDLLHQQVQDLRNNLLQACRVRPNVRVDLIYHDVCRNVPREVTSRVSLLSIRPSMVRTQAEHRPNIPYTFEGLDIVLQTHQELRMSLDGQCDLYQGISGLFGHRSLLFLSRRVVTGAGNIRYLFGDATFYARPNHPDSMQLYTLVTVRDNHILPLAYALMESRSQVAYQDLFSFIRRIVPELDPDYFMTDFETAQQNAVLDTFPRVRLSGCLWHYSRAVCRNIRSLGLHALVRDNPNARRVVRLCLAIPLAPPGRLFEALNAILVEARRLDLHDQLLNFFNYLRATWIQGIGERILNMLHEMEDVAWRDLGRLEVGLAPSRARRVTSLLSDARIRSCSRQVMNQEMDILHFLSTVSWHLEGTLQDMLRERLDDEDRPPSPSRGPPPRVSDEFRLGQVNCDSLRNFDCELDIGSQDNTQLPNADHADLFEDLMEGRRDELP
ncbi:putative WRKY transcription factor 4 [Frankliniella fusca]|uniref:WRKY transcription factor 4 n=1 Tax=Frankliniella fusca TaxID=407009 RepID=A0AAE1L9W6_9NEOP|nr:putative WRKY transcription factor 4 [Frankliniella fusca]